jgi:hypothetical protein
MLDEVCACAQVPEALAASCIIGILSASIGSGLEVKSGGDRRTRGNLFTLVVAESGTGKGQAFKIIAEAFLAFEKRALDGWKTNVQPGCLAEKAAAESEIIHLKKSVPKSEGEKREQLMDKMREAQKRHVQQSESLIPPCLYIGDTTKEAVAVALSEQPGEALASLSAEARGVVDVIAGRYGNGKTDEDIYLSGYSGDSCKVRRINRPPIWLKSPTLSILWLIQPDVLEKILKNPNLTESGLLPRFLVCNTRAEPQEMPESPQAMNPEIVAAWVKLIATLLEVFRQNGSSPSVIEYTPEAFETLRHFNNDIVRRRKTGGDLIDIATYASRWAEQAWRLCVVLHAAEHGADAPKHPLSALTAHRAVTLANWFAQEQLGMLKDARVERRMNKLERVREILRGCPGNRLPIRELERRHNLKRDELEKLATAFPHLLTIEVQKPAGAGRPSHLVCIPSS